MATVAPQIRCSTRAFPLLSFPSFSPLEFALRNPPSFCVSLIFSPPQATASTDHPVEELSSWRATVSELIFVCCYQSEWLPGCLLRFRFRLAINTAWTKAGERTTSQESPEVDWFWQGDAYHHLNPAGGEIRQISVVQHGCVNKCVKS